MKLLVARSVSPSLLLRSSTFNVVLYSKKNTSSLRKPSLGGMLGNSWWRCGTRFATSWIYFKPTSFNYFPSPFLRPSLQNAYTFSDLASAEIMLPSLSDCLHVGGGPPIGEVTCGGPPHPSCTRHQIKMRYYMDRRVTSPSWGPPLACKQALRLER